jgi:hypothetical protein
LITDLKEHSGGALDASVSGEFIDLAGERYYAIRNVDHMAPFFISLISNKDHWLFVSSTGGLTAGRVSPDTALFPYITVDKIHESAAHTGSKTLLHVLLDGNQYRWEPFENGQSGRYTLTRNLYKNTLGNKLCYEEFNHDLRLIFRYTWKTSDSYGFVRDCELENRGDRPVSVDMLDGLQNILPAGTPRFAQTNTSNLVDAYKWTELDANSGLALFTLFSAVTDRAEPCESLKANTVFCLGLNGHKTLLSAEQLDDFRTGAELRQEQHKRGIRGAYLVNAAFALPPRKSRHWQIVADIEKTQSQVVELQKQLADPAKVADAIAESVERGSDELARIMAAADGFQAVAEENVAVHHYANVLFNVLRGGIFDDQYNVSSWDFSCTLGNFNHGVHQRHREMLSQLPDTLTFSELLSAVKAQDDPQLERLCHEYLPIRFGRRHGDPSRPWNQFAIRLKDDFGNRLLSYEGNWRDIFQNWEALAFSYPDFIENIIAKFVNASTVDGYNPYRITKDGIDWEVEEPDDPWSYIGYWGDHQIIYLQKLLELSRHFHPARLGSLLHEPIFSYANVPYKIKPFEALLRNPKNTVEYDAQLADKIEHRVTNMGADGKLVLDSSGTVYQVNLLEKLLVPLLAKLGNLVIDGGIWMNTQRPEWNDANNALVGQGLSMVTLYYMRRYVRFLRQTLGDKDETTEISTEVSRWLDETSKALAEVRPLLGGDPISPEQRFASLAQLGQAASRCREIVYTQEGFSGKDTRALSAITGMLDDALVAIDHSIANNQRENGLYHAYNLLNLKKDAIRVDPLYKMLEGQVAALSSGAIKAQEVASVIEALFDSDIYRHDQHSFMLYPDRALPSFLEKNRIPAEALEQFPVLQRMLAEGDKRIVTRDAAGTYRFNAEFVNVGALNARLNSLVPKFGEELEAARGGLLELYETVFDHKSFTGRSGGMFGFEGLGCIYWHMVSKLLLAVQENFFAALDSQEDSKACHRLGQLYYRIRKGIGFNKTPQEYGAFPTDPYSHTPGNVGARQPGMTGQVKEEILSRFGELGVRVSGGMARFQPALLRAREFVTSPGHLRFLDVDGVWQELQIGRASIAFTWCQVPIIYELIETGESSLTLTLDSNEQKSFAQLALPADESSALFSRSGHIRQVRVRIQADALFAE